MPVLQLNSVKDTTLWRQLNQGYLGAEEDLAQALSVYVVDVCREAYDRMRGFASLHPQFTLHDEVHLLRVTELMSRIMPAATLDRLNPVELVLLILAAHFHDQGMVLESEELDGLNSNQEFRIFQDNWEIEHPNLRDVRQRIRDRNLSDSELRRLHETEHELQAALLTDYIRITHGERSASLVRAKYGQDPRWAVSETNIAELVARLCLSHVRPATDLTPTNGFRFDESIGPYRVNMPYLGLILRLADILDLDRDRTPDSLYRTINFKSGVSLKEWDKHRVVDGWVIEPTLIQFTMRCEHPEYQRAAYQFMDLIDKELTDAQHMIRNFPALVAAYRLDLPLAVDRSRIEPKDNSYIYRDLEFSLSRDEIVKLLMTNKLYGGPWLCVRELLQNSLDALRYRKALIKRDNGTDWEHGRVEMHHGVDEHGHEVIHCTDNGAGMDRGIVERFLTKAGRSYYRSPEFEQERASFRAACFDFDPCAQFGIGFMSSFMLGDHVVIRTRRDYGPIRGLGEPLIIEINGLGGIVVIREGRNDQEAGTTVEITGRRKPRFVDEFVDQVKLLEVIEGYALACEFPIEARCSIPELEESVTIPPRLAMPRTSLEDSEIKQYVTIEQNFSDVHPSLSGLIKASFIVDEEGHFTLNNSEARWNLGTVSKMHYVELVNADGTQIERYFPRRENQICMDGILVSGHPGRDDREGRRRNTIGYAGPHIEMGRAVYILDIRGDIKPQLTPARTVPEDRSAFREISPRWGYISLLSNKAHGRLWERVAEQLEHGLSPQTFWQLAIIYSEHTTDIVWMRAGAIWSLVSVPILYDDGRYEWKNFSTLGVLKPVSKGEETTKRSEKSSFQLVSTDGWQIGPYDQLTEWRESNQDRVDWDLRYIAASMSTVVIEGGEAKLEFRAPSQPDMPPWEVVFSDSFSLILALPHSGEIKDYYSVHLPCRCINRYHPLVSEALRAKYLEQPSALQEFASRAVYFLSDPEAIAILDDAAKPVTRWHKYVSSKFMDVDWQAVSPELHPPYKILLEDGRTVLVSAEDFERWANAMEYKR